jgi:hypothetical protein
VFERVKFLVTGLQDSVNPFSGEVVTEMFDWADRCALLGFSGERSTWLRELGRSSYCPRIVNRGSYPERCRCSSCRAREG